MAKEFPIGTIRNWESGDVIKAHDPIQPYSNGWIPLKTSPELERIGRECDRLASNVKDFKLPINGEKFLDHEIDEFEDEDGNKPFVADDFKQYNGFFGAGYYSFRNEFSKLFMNNAMKLNELVANALMDANDAAGGDKHNDKLTPEQRKEIRARVKDRYKDADVVFTVKHAEKLQSIIERTLEQIKEGLDFKDPAKRAVYENFKKVADSLPETYEKIKIKRGYKREILDTIEEVFSDNWGVRESCKDYMNKKFDEYVKKYSDEIAQDSLDEQMEKYGVTIDMPADEFYPRIFKKVNEFRFQSPDEDEDDFKELIYLRFIKKYNKSVEGDWKLDHLPAVHNLEQAILDLPEGHFLTNDMLTMITNKNYKGGSHGGYAWYDGRDKRINFSAACIDRGSVFGVLANPTEFKSTLYHEIGHAVSKKLGRSEYYDYKRFVVDCGWTYESKELRAGITATGDQKDIPRTGSNSQVKLISEYSGKAPEEAFAEYYAFYASNKTAIDKFLVKGDRNFLKEQSKVVCNTESSERSIMDLGLRSRILSDDHPHIETFNKVKDRLSYGAIHNKIELISPWQTSLSHEEKKNVSPEKLKTRKDYSVDSMPPIVSYSDNGKNVVLDGATRVEVSRINKKLVPSITISKELYHTLKENHFTDHDIANCVYSKNRHERILRETVPKVRIHGLIHRDNLISVDTIVQNTSALRTMSRIFHSKELEKAMKDLFGQEEDIEKGGGGEPIGTEKIRHDGKRYKKVLATGDPAKDWKLVTKDKTGGGEESKTTKYKSTPLTTHAKQTSEVNLLAAIKQSSDPKIREVAHKEIERRANEEKPQEKKDEKLKGGKADKQTIDSIAKKHKVDVSVIKRQLSLGLVIEMEHTTDVNQAMEIAMDHLTESPEYYTKLKKMEASLKTDKSKNNNKSK